MANLTASVAKGKQLFELITALYLLHDNASDNMSAGAYSHNPLEGSATEQDLVVSLLLYLMAVAKQGGGALNVYNNTGAALPAGPVKLVGYNGLDTYGVPQFLITGADARINAPALAYIGASLANATAGNAYVGGVLTFDTSRAQVGSVAYLAVGGGIAFADPSAIFSLLDSVTQILGYVITVGTAGTIAMDINPPVKLGKSFVRAVDATAIGSGGSVAAYGAQSLYSFANFR